MKELTLAQQAGQALALHSQKIELILDRLYSGYEAGEVPGREIRDWIRLQLQVVKTSTELSRGPEVSIELRDDGLIRKLKTTLKELTPDERRDLARLAQGVTDRS